MIAEGVETLEQQQLLLNKGCMYFQGYLFGRPVPIVEFEAAFKQKLHILSENFKELHRANARR